MPVLRIPGRWGSHPDQDGGLSSHDDSARGPAHSSHPPDPDQWRAPRYDMQLSLERNAVEARVKELAESLDGAIDEGTGASLDRLIESWTLRWVATVHSEYSHHCAEINARRVQARQRLAETTFMAEHEKAELDHLRSDLAASRRRLSGESPNPVPPPATAATTTPPATAATMPLAAAATTTAPTVANSIVLAPPRPSPHQDWTEPHLVAGRGRIGLIVGAILITVGAMADTIAFHNVLELVLPTEQQTFAWLMAGGSTSLALVVAATLGIARAIRRRGRYLAPRHRPPRLPVIASSTVWLGMGLAMFLIRWQDSNTSGFSLTSPSAPTQGAIWQAVFFLAIYLISGVCTIFEAERLYNPEYAAFQRLRKEYATQAKAVAEAEAERERAQAAVDRCDAELQTQGDLRDHAIADRRGLGAEAANYARIVMAGLMHDPAKTGITETGPVHMPPILPGVGPTPTPTASTGSGPGQPPGIAGTP